MKLSNTIKKLNFATVIFIIAAFVTCCYFLTYLFAVTDNAFVFNNRIQVAALVDGYVDEIYVRNGQKLNKGDKILKIKPKTYELNYEMASAEYEQASLGLITLQKSIEATQLTLKASQDQLARMEYEYQQKSAQNVSKAITILELKSLEYNIQSQKNEVASLAKEVEVQQAALAQDKANVRAFKASQELAKDKLEHTVVYAQTDGYLQNMYASNGLAVAPGSPLFLYVDTSETFVQANMIETDIGDIREGDKVLIYPRTYLFEKIYHGTVMSSFSSVQRQTIIPGSESQFIQNENKWLLLPQRFPIQIRIDDLDEEYPLLPGMSTYVYVQGR
jgi:multidrug resistance efflux pump